MRTINKRLTFLESQVKVAHISAEQESAIRFVRAWWKQFDSDGNSIPEGDPPEHFNELERQAFEALKSVRKKFKEFAG